MIGIGEQQNPMPDMPNNFSCLWIKTHMAQEITDALLAQKSLDNRLNSFQLAMAAYRSGI